MSRLAAARRAGEFLALRGITPEVADIFLVVGQSNAGQTTPVPNPVPFATSTGVAWGIMRHPQVSQALSGPFQNGATVTPGFGQSAGWPHFAQTWFAETGRRSLWANFAVAGQSLVPAAIPSNPQWWGAGDLSKCLAGDFTYSEGDEDKTRRELIRDAIQAIEFNPRFSRGFVVAIWVQGEADANSVALGRLTGADYEAGLDDLFTFMSGAFGVDMFLVVELGRKGTDSAEVDANEASGYAAIRAAQNAVAAARSDTFIVFDGCKEKGSPFNTLEVDPDFLHISGMSYQADGVHMDAQGNRCVGVSAAHGAIAAALSMG